MSDRQSDRPPPWPDRDPHDTQVADQRPEEAPAEGAEEREGEGGEGRKRGEAGHEDSAKA